MSPEQLAMCLSWATIRVTASPASPAELVEHWRGMPEPWKQAYLRRAQGLARCANATAQDGGALVAVNHRLFGRGVIVGTRRKRLEHFYEVMFFADADTRFRIRVVHPSTVRFIRRRASRTGTKEIAA